jgi:cytochrome b561
MAIEPISRHDRLLHWLLAVMVIGMLILGKVVDEMDHRGYFEVLRSAHINLGIFVFLLGSYRLRCRIVAGFPTPIASLRRWEQRGSQFVHWTLLIATLLMPVSGVAMAVARRIPIELLGLFPLPRLAERMSGLGSSAATVHELTAILILLCLATHIGAALKHHFVDRDEVLRRMLGRA